jgi:hypothetical protein
VVKRLRVARHINTLMRAKQFTEDAVERHKRNRYIRRLHQMTGWDISHLELLSNDELRDLHVQHQQERNDEPTDTVDINTGEAMSASARMQRALQREKEKREFSQRYAEKNFPIGKKPDPIKEPKKDEGMLSFMTKDKPVNKKKEPVDPYAAKLLANRHKHKPEPVKLKIYQGPEDYRKEKGVAEGMCEVCGTSLAEHGKASLKLCKSSRPDNELGASNLASCKSQGLRARDGDKSHKLGRGPESRVKVGGHKIRGKKYGGPLPDWS